MRSKTCAMDSMSMSVSLTSNTRTDGAAVIVPSSSVHSTTTTIFPPASPASMMRCASRISSKREDPRRRCLEPAGGHLIGDVLQRHVDSGKPGSPNMKLPKKFQLTPLGMRSSGLKSPMGSSPPNQPHRHAVPSRRSMSNESRIVLLPTRSRTASICLASAMPAASVGDSSSTRATPRDSSRLKRSRFRAVAMTRAPAATAILTAAWPNDDVAPRMTMVWPAPSFRLWKRQVHAVANVSGSAANCDHGKSDSMRATLAARTRVYSA